MSNKNSCVLTLGMTSAVSAHRAVVLSRITRPCAVIILNKCLYFVHQDILMTIISCAAVREMTALTAGLRKLTVQQYRDFNSYGVSMAHSRTSLCFNRNQKQNHL